MVCMDRKGRDRRYRRGRASAGSDVEKRQMSKKASEVGGWDQPGNCFMSCRRAVRACVRASVRACVCARGLVVGWSGGPVVRWSGGPVARWSGGLVVRWSGGPVVRWSGSVDHGRVWSGGPVVW